MSLGNNSINQIYKSRKTILELLDSKGYNVEQYIEFSVNEIDAMVNANQLDILLEHPETKKKTYVKYSLSTKQVRWTNNLDEIIEDLYEIENTLTKNDDLIIIINEEPNDNLVNKLKYIYDSQGIFIVIHNIARLQFNILKHTLVPSGKILSKDEKEKMYKEYNINNDKQLPQISRFDPQSLALCVRPKEVIEFNRKSINSINSLYYRICI
jgi:DNA-directed RNA polymerase subunit H (RpoH/RPB5)